MSTRPSRSAPRAHGAFTDTLREFGCSLEENSLFFCLGNFAATT